MYDLPGNEKIAKCIITKDSITGAGKPVLEEGERKKKLEGKAGAKAAKKIENAS
jgi:hypothetical protein